MLRTRPVIFAPGVYFSVKIDQGSGSSCFRPSEDTLALGIDLEDLTTVHFLADLEHLARMLDLLRPRHLADVDETLDARLEEAQDECTP